MDVKTSFLNCDLIETVYIQQPEGFHTGGSENLVYKLKRSIHGLKQASRQWYKKSMKLLLPWDLRRVRLINAYTSRSVGANLFSLCCMWMIFCWLLMTLACCMRQSRC